MKKEISLLTIVKTVVILTILIVLIIAASCSSGTCPSYSESHSGLSAKSTATNNTDNHGITPPYTERHKKKLCKSIKKAYGEPTSYDSKIPERPR